MLPPKLCAPPPSNTATSQRGRPNACSSKHVAGRLCFQFDAEGWDMLTGAKKSNRHLHEQSLMQTTALPTIVAVSAGKRFDPGAEYA